jgi:hypothetical protein
MKQERTELSLNCTVLLYCSSSMLCVVCVCEDNTYLD